METFKKLGKIAIPAAALALPFLTLAVTVPGVDVPGGTAITLDEIEDLINQIANFIIIIGVVIAVIFIVWGGIRYVTAGGDPTAQKAAKDTIINGVIGAAVVLGVGVILSTVAGLVTRTFFD